MIWEYCPIVLVDHAEHILMQERRKLDRCGAMGSSVIHTVFVL
jgi:hypothetical protein